MSRRNSPKTNAALLQVPMMFSCAEIIISLTRSKSSPILINSIDNKTILKVLGSIKWGNNYEFLFLFHVSIANQLFFNY